MDAYRLPSPTSLRSATSPKGGGKDATHILPSYRIPMDKPTKEAVSMNQILKTLPPRLREGFSVLTPADWDQLEEIRQWALVYYPQDVDQGMAWKYTDEL